MNDSHRRQFRDQVRAAMDEKSLTATAVAALAGISPNTMTRIMKLGDVTPETVGKVRAALDIEALAPAQSREGYGDDVDLVRDVVGMWLRDIPVGERPKKVARVIACIIAKG